VTTSATSQSRGGCARASKARAVVVGCVVEIAVLVVLGTSVVATLTDVTETTSCAASDVLGYTRKLVVTLFAAAENTTLCLELVHGHGGQSSGLVVGSSIVVDLVDGDGGVDNIGLDNLPVDYGLDSLVDVLWLC
jgi:hypothetical protein